jgi:uncharacterized membrane protein YhhN
MVSKPLIVISLLSYYLLSVNSRQNTFIAALFFCWLGDVFLMIEGERYFMLGLSAFLIGHMLYIASYRALRVKNISEGLLNTQKVRFSLPIILAGTGLVSILYSHLGALKIPVMIYALVLTVMVLQALFRFGFTSSKSFSLVFIGALFFMISDSLLAINKFMNPIPHASAIVMFTYILAQFLIVQGSIVHHDSLKGKNQ